MSEPRPDKWADLLRPTYDYPEEMKSGDLTRRQRRRARRQWRREDRRSRKQWITERREGLRGEAPVEQRGGCAVVLIAVALVVIIAGLVRQSGQEPATAPEPTSTTAAAAPTSPTGPTAEPTGPVEPTPTDERVDDDLPAEDVLENWVRAWFTFTPTTGDHEAARMQRSEPLMTGELARFLWQDDLLARYYTDAGIDLTVQDVAITLPEEGTAPVDHATRLTRLVTFTTTYTAGPDAGQEFTSTYAAALYRAQESDPWRVGDYTSADGH